MRSRSLLDKVVGEILSENLVLHTHSLKIVGFDNLDTTTELLTIVVFSKIQKNSSK